MNKTEQYKENANNALTKAKRLYWESRARSAAGTPEPGSKQKWLKRHPPDVGAQKCRRKAAARKREKRIMSVLLKSPYLWTTCEACHITHNDLILYVTEKGDIGDEGTDLYNMVELVRKTYCAERDRLVKAGRIPKRNE